MKGFTKPQQTMFLAIGLAVFVANFFWPSHRPFSLCSNIKLEPPHQQSVMNVRESFVLGVPVNVNRANAEDLALIPGISEQLARRIVESRQSQGTFKTWDDLRRVKGVGPANIKRFQNYLSLR